MKRPPQAQVSLEVTFDGVTSTVILTEEALIIGRAPTSGLSLIDPSLSWQHASIRLSEGEVLIQDLNSTNGTTLNGVRLRGEAVLEPGAEVKLGRGVTLRCVAWLSPPPITLVLEDLRRGWRFPLHIGLTPLSGLGVAEGGEVRLTEEGDLFYEGPGGRVPLVLDQPLRVDGAHFKVVALERAPTLGQRDEPWPYRLILRTTGPLGLEASIVDRSNGLSHRITSENRAALVYQLGRKVLQDLALGVAPEDVGWCEDEALSVGIWGKGARSSSALPVLVHRLRKDLTLAGFDHRFIEKSRLVMRVLLRDVVMGDAPATPSEG